MTIHSVDELARMSLALATEVLAGGQHGVGSTVLTLPEVAALLRVQETAVRRLAVTGEIPGRLIEGEWRFLKGTVLSWLAGGDSRRVKTVGGWREDSAFPREEWRSAPAVAVWGDDASREAEEFIKRVQEARKATIVSTADETR